jgi:mRNA interferase MazF
MDLGSPGGSEPGYRRPCVIVQNDAFNRSRISTTVVAVITTNLRLGDAFGNVPLRKGEAGLPCRSVVNVSQIATIDKSMLSGRVGKLSARRLDEVITGIHASLHPVEM